MTRFDQVHNDATLCALQDSRFNDQNVVKP